MFAGGTHQFVMLKTLLSGLLLVVAAFLTVIVGQWLDLEVESTTLLGVATGAVVAFVPDASVGRRLAGFALGVAAAVLGYYVRAGVTPDTTAGRAVFAALVVALCVAVTAAGLGKLPLWSALLGAATFAGAFEAAYSAAPTRVVDNSLSALTTLALCVAVGFLAAGVIGADRESKTSDRTDDNAADRILEGTK